MKTIKIYNAQDRIEAERVLSELKKEGIECYTMDADVGEYMRIVEGFSVYGCDIYVKEDEKEKAQSVIDDLILLQKQELEKEEKPVKKMDKRRIIAVVLLVWIIIGLLIGIIY